MSATSMLLRLAVRAHLALLWVGSRIGRRPLRAGAEPVDILLTLNFHAAGWPKALLGPLAQAPRTGRVRIVTTTDAPGLVGIEVVSPPAWMCRVCGKTGARLLTFVAVAIRTRPAIVGGVHLLFNGLVAALAARLSGARALYVCVGGPNEVAGGGIRSENRAFGRLPREDRILEELLLRCVASFDQIITMGSRADAYFSARGVTCPIAVIPSGVDPAEFPPGPLERDLDVILVARLAPVKRLDLFVRSLARLAERRPDLQAVVIGRGPEREPSEALVRELGIERHVRFLGPEPDAAPWLRRSRVFLLTSDTEGVSISLIEAMLSGAVPVVSDVGDLADVVTNEVDGVLVGERTPDGFACAVERVLADRERWATMSMAASRAARAFTPLALAGRWNAVLSEQVLNERK